MRASIIGSGFSGLMSACVLADEGFDVRIYEKNPWLGGRASSFQSAGFHFDKGPSWYWMPDIFERAFERLGWNISELYTLERLDPAFRVYFGPNDFIDIPDNYEQLRQLFESLEKGAANNLDRFMREAAIKYDIGVNDMARLPSLSILEFLNFKALRSALQMDMFKSVSSQVRALFKNEKIRHIMEFPVLFLGASAKKIPALYTMMNYAGLKLGTFYPQGGFSQVIDAFVRVAKSKGVNFELNAAITEMKVSQGRVSHLQIEERSVETDVVIGAGDYVHMESLLPEQHRNYSEEYWEKRVFAPSSLLFYLGIDKRLKNIQHHNLFFHSDFELHTEEIYTKPSWPSDPLFYVCCPSLTDDSVAPEGCENLFFLMPIAAGLTDSPQLRQDYFNRLISSFEKITGEQIKEHIIVNESYCLADFESEYNAYKGNAYGLANTLNQTAILKPSIRNKKVSNLFYTGQLTVPGPGVPPSIISGEIVGDQVTKLFMTKKQSA
jgi:phytoene desaturase